MATFTIFTRTQTPEVIMASTQMNSGEIRITNINPKLKEQLSTIAKNYDYTYLNDFLRMHLKRIVENTPPEKKIKKEDY